MGDEPARHVQLIAELNERWKDLQQADAGSRVVLVSVPDGWGRSRVLDAFEAHITSRGDAPVTLTVRVNGQDLPGEPALQAQVLHACLTGAALEQEAAALLEVDRPSGLARLGLELAPILLFPGVLPGLLFLLADRTVGAVVKAWDASPAGHDGALARTARSVAAVSVSAPVVVIIDDGDCLDQDLAVTMVDNLTARHDGRILIVAAVDPDSALAATLTSRISSGVTGGLVQFANADPDMGYESRLKLARKLCPNLPDAGARLIAQRTITFDEVFTAAGAPVLAELGQDSDQVEVLTVVDAAVSAWLARPAPSREATLIAWAGGLVHARQADRALSILHATRREHDPDVRRWESLERVSYPTSPRLARLVVAELTTQERRAVAAAFLDEALTITRAREASLLDKVAALQAAHRVRTYLPKRGQLPRAQCELVAALEELGDGPAARQVATEALAGWPAEGEHQDDRDALAGAVIRLSQTAPETSAGPLAEQLIGEAVAGGAAIGLEARIWAAIVLLDTPGQREAALTLADQAAAELEAASGLGTSGARWRLLLAYHVGRAGLPDLAMRLLTPLITSADPALQDAARALRRARLDEPGSDIRLQNILLEAELDTVPPDADDDRLRIHHALAANYATIGDPRRALTHGQHELDLRTQIQGPHHPMTLAACANVASLTERSGDPTGALRLYRELLPDMEQVLGRRHRTTLTARTNIARATGMSGDLTGALRLYRELLPDMEQVLGRRDPGTLVVRNEIGHWTGECGDAAGRLRLYRELLPDMEQVLGRRHPFTLATRSGIVRSTDECGNPAGALRLARDLVPDMEQVLGPRHPETLITRSDIARSTGECGNPAEALDLLRELLPDMEQVFGRRHPMTLVIRNNTARWTSEASHYAEALRLFCQLLPDMEQVLGRHHPDTLACRSNIAFLTFACGGDAKALRLFRQLLPVEEQVLGRHHPNTLTTRNAIADLTRKIRGGR